MSQAVSTVLFVDDDADVQRAAAMLLQRHGFRVCAARSPAESWSVLAAEPVDVVLLDLNFSRGATTGAEGIAHLRALVAHDPAVVAVVVTGHSGIAIAVEAMRSGAADFVMKPWHNERLVQTLTQAAALHRQRRAMLPDPVQAPAPVIGQSTAMVRLMSILHRAAPTAAPVLLSGEPGTGKTLLAQTIHRLSARPGPLVVVDAGALGTDGQPAGLPDGVDPAGTLVLELAGALPASLQARLLAALDARPGLRVVTALRPQAAAGLGADLLSRLNTVEISIPRLADRPGDAAILADYFLALFSRQHGRPSLAFSTAAAAGIAAWPWPGNVRALRQAVERAVVLAAGPVIEASELALAPLDGQSAAPDRGDLNLARSEKAIVEAALRRHGFNVSHAAQELGVTRATLYRRMARHGL